MLILLLFRHGHVCVPMHVCMCITITPKTHRREQKNTQTFNRFGSAIET